MTTPTEAPNPWRDLYRRAINEANGLTNYVEDRPELRSAERRLAKIEEDARAALAQAEQPAEQAQPENPCKLTECQGKPRCKTCLAMGAAPPAAQPPPATIQQIIYALERQERALQAQSDALLAAMDYNAEFPAEDAERMREAQALLKAMARP